MAKTTEQVIDSIDEALARPVIGCPTIHHKNQKVREDYNDEPEESSIADFFHSVFDHSNEEEHWVGQASPSEITHHADGCATYTINGIEHTRPIFPLLPPMPPIAIADLMRRGATVQPVDENQPLPEIESSSLVEYSLVDSEGCRVENLSDLIEQVESFPAPSPEETYVALNTVGFSPLLFQQQVNQADIEHNNTEEYLEAISQFTSTARVITQGVLLDIIDNMEPSAFQEFIQSDLNVLNAYPAVRSIVEDHRDSLLEEDTND